MNRIQLDISPLRLDIRWPETNIGKRVFLPRNLSPCFSKFIRNVSDQPHETLDVVSAGFFPAKSGRHIETLAARSLNLPLSKFPFTKESEFFDNRSIIRLKPFCGHPRFKAITRDLSGPEEMACRLMSGGCLVRNQRMFQSTLLIRPVSGRRTKLTSLSQAAYFVSAMGLPRLDSCLLHGVGLRCNGHGLLALGGSGSGKSTVAGLFGPMTVVSDDGIIVEQKNGKYLLAPTPFDQHINGENHLSAAADRKLSLKMGFFLEKGERVRIKPIHPAEACCRIIKHHIHFFGYLPTESADRLFSLVVEMCRRIPFFRLSFRKDPSFRPVVEKQLRSVLQCSGGAK